MGTLEHGELKLVLFSLFVSESGFWFRFDELLEEISEEDEDWCVRSIFKPPGLLVVFMLMLLLLLTEPPVIPIRPGLFFMLSETDRLLLLMDLLLLAIWMG